ncbi:MAG: transglutaminase-like domain-containing protein [Erysipelotrichaceae bacterium]
MVIKQKHNIIILIIILFLLFSCSKKGVNNDSLPIRDNEPIVLIPVADKTLFVENEVASIDYSHNDQGYVIVDYQSNKKAKLQIKCPDANVYTYSLSGGKEVFPLTQGNGKYTITVNEALKDKEYFVVLMKTIEVTLENEFVPFLYPNKYVNFNVNNKIISQGSDIVKESKTELEVVEKVYNYVIESLEYDFEKAKNVKSGYTPIIDDVIDQGKGICFDYASVMASILRSQRIPTRMDIGYVNDVYHAWISVYIKEIGWVNGLIEFDGVSWKLMDPTFEDTSSLFDNLIKKDGSNYITKYRY